MKCPACNKETEYAGNPYRPFCSERCKLIDLGAWASEQRSIADSGSEAEEKPKTGDEESG